MTGKLAEQQGQGKQEKRGKEGFGFC